MLRRISAPARMLWQASCAFWKSGSSPTSGPIMMPRWPGLGSGNFSTPFFRMHSAYLRPFSSCCGFACRLRPAGCTRWQASIAFWTCSWVTPEFGSNLSSVPLPGSGSGTFDPVLAHALGELHRHLVPAQARRRATGGGRLAPGAPGPRRPGRRGSSAPQPVSSTTAASAARRQCRSCASHLLLVR